MMKAHLLPIPNLRDNHPIAYSGKPNPSKRQSHYTVPSSSTCTFLSSPEEGGSEEAVNATSPANDTSSDQSSTAAGGGKGKKDKATKKEKQPPEVKENTVKVNLTADVTVLDLQLPSEASTTVSTNK